MGRRAAQFEKPEVLHVERGRKQERHAGAAPAVAETHLQFPGNQGGGGGAFALNAYGHEPAAIDQVIKPALWSGRGRRCGRVRWGRGEGGRRRGWCVGWRG